MTSIYGSKWATISLDPLNELAEGVWATEPDHLVNHPAFFENANGRHGADAAVVVLVDVHLIEGDALEGLVVGKLLKVRAELLAGSAPMSKVIDGNTLASLYFGG